MTSYHIGCGVLVGLQIAILCVYSGYFRKPKKPVPRIPYFALYLAKLNCRRRLK